VKERLRFGVIGCGVIGTTHAEAIAAVDDAELVAVCDEDRQRAEALAARYDVRPYADLDQMLAREKLDIVNICTPSGLHSAAACAAMRSGRHVLVEKPIEITLDAIDEMLRVQKETGVKLGVVFQHRFDPASQRVHALAHDGAFGRLSLGTAQLLWWRSQKYYDSGAWRGTWKLDGGGVLMNQTIHTIDLLLWTMGPVRSVRAYADTLAHQMETEDTAVAALRFQSGALGSVVATTGAYPGVVTRLELLGDAGSAIVENDELTYLHLRREEDAPAGDYGAAPASKGPGGTEGARSNPAGMGSAGHALQIADMISAVRENRPPLVDGRAARMPVELILAIYESAQTGREVVLP
jgi:UDP-N-acetyl-2-amino-2-deoxyglucuronate dehydrogenase